MIGIVLHVLESCSILSSMIVCHQLIHCTYGYSSFIICLLQYAQFSRRQIVVYVRNCEQERGTLTRRWPATLSLSVDELDRLNKMGRDLYIEIDAVLALLDNPLSDLIQRNVARRISRIRDDLLHFVQGISRYQRTAATHVLVTMISPSQRDKKPYALPVSCIPYAGLTETKARQHYQLGSVRKRNMKIAGKFVFNNVFILNN